MNSALQSWIILSLHKTILYLLMRVAKLEVINIKARSAFFTPHVTLHTYIVKSEETSQFFIIKDGQ